MLARTASGRPVKQALVWLVLVVTVANTLVLRPGTAEAVDGKAQGRKHAQKAAKLAAANNCRAAVVEYGKALALLKDPVLLFNRAECYRRLDDRERALADYRQFIEQVPNAPNRTQVAVRISELENPAAAATKPAPPAAAPAPPVATPPPVATAPRPVPAPAPPVAAPAPPTDRPMEATPDFAGAPPDSIRSIDTSPRPTYGEPQVTLVDGDPPRSDADASDSIARKWWFWTAIGVVLIGGGVATYLVARPAETDIPSSGLGNYPF